MSSFSTEILARSDFLLRIAVVLLGLLTAGVSVVALFVRSELDQRREQDALKVREQVQAAQADASRLRASLAPRDVSAQQRATLLATLKDQDGEVFLIYPSDEEAQMFGEKVAAVLAEAGWRIRTEGGPSFGPVFGFHIQVGGDDVPSYVAPLEQALRLAFPDEPIKTSTRTFIGGERVRLQVGMKRRIAGGDQ